MRLPQAFAILLAVGLVGACGEGSKENVRGTLAAPECEDGYEIVNAQVELRNEKNEIIGTATTSENELVQFPDLGCLVTFTLPEVPEAKFYSIEVGTHEGPNYSMDEMESQNWRMSLGLDDAQADFPRPTLEEFCSHISDLNDTLNDVDLYNDHPSEWTTTVEEQAEILREDGAGYVLHGDVEKASEIAEATISLTVMSKVTNPYVSSTERYFERLNASVEPANIGMPPLVTECEARGYWNQVEFIPARP